MECSRWCAARSQAPTITMTSGKTELAFLRGFAEFHFGVPCADCLRCVMNRIDPKLFMVCFSSWVAACWPDKLDLVATQLQRLHLHHIKSHLPGRATALPATAGTSLEPVAFSAARMAEIGSPADAGADPIEAAGPCRTHGRSMRSKNRRHPAGQLRRRIVPIFLLGLRHSPDMGGQILQTGLQATAAMVLLKIIHDLRRSSVRKFMRHDLREPRRRFPDNPCPIIHRAKGFAAFGTLINMPLDRNNLVRRVVSLR
jgi:hypothetical protein